jgi:hypothetical protein
MKRARAWLRSYWEVRAALAGLTVPWRITEHYRRLHRALSRTTRALRKWGAPPTNALLLEQPDLPFDDRGILLPHGEPFETIRSLAYPPDHLQNESCAYPRLEGGYRLLHFVKYDSPPARGQSHADFVLVYNVLCDGDWLADRILHDRRLLFASCDAFGERSIGGEVRRDARTLLRTDSHRPDFAPLVPFVYDSSLSAGETA